MSDTVFNTTRGSDVLLSFSIEDSAGNPIDLTGGTIEFFDVSNVIAGRITSTITDAVNGRFTVSIEGTDPIITGDHAFRVQFNGASSIGIPRCILRVT